MFLISALNWIFIRGPRLKLSVQSLPPPSPPRRLTRSRHRNVVIRSRGDHPGRECSKAQGTSGRLRETAPTRCCSGRLLILDFTHRSGFFFPPPPLAEEPPHLRARHGTPPNAAALMENGHFPAPHAQGAGGRGGSLPTVTPTSPSPSPSPFLAGG